MEPPALADRPDDRPEVARAVASAAVRDPALDAALNSALAAALEAVLPSELPRRAALLAGALHHAQLLLAANERLNLTRITAPRDLAVKHVLDSLLPWRRFLELFPEPLAAPLTAPPATSPAESPAASPDRAAPRRATLADLGSGGGYPGLLLALLLPHVDVTLIESIGKKAAFLRETGAAMGLANVTVEARRGEVVLRERPVDVVTARAVDAARELLRLLKPLPAHAARLVLYKGPDALHEQAQAAKEAEKQQLDSAITFRGALPDDGAQRFLLEYAPRARG